jgi:predicted RNase H-like HicB family nuclease
MKEIRLEMKRKYPDNYIYPPIMEKEENGYSVFFPDFGGAFTAGITLTDAEALAKEPVFFS